VSSQRSEEPRLDHIGIAVRSIEQALELYRTDLAFEAERPVEVPQEQVRVVMVPLGQSRIELLEATSDDSPIAGFIAKRGEGIHHMALKVKDLNVTVERLRASGRRLVTESIQSGGAGGYRYIFVHPKSAGGVLLELIEE
jgi:methylmalonyl-CoA epimerase